MSVEEHAVDRIFVVGVPVEFSNPVVGGVRNRESADGACAVRLGYLPKASCASRGRGRRLGATEEALADRASRCTRCLQELDRIHHAIATSVSAAVIVPCGVGLRTRNNWRWG